MTPTAMQAYNAFESAFSTADLMASTASFAGLTTNQTFTANSVNTFTETNVSTAAGVNLTFNAQGDANAIFIVRVDGSFNVNGPADLHARKRSAGEQHLLDRWHGRDDRRRKRRTVGF